MANSRKVLIAVACLTLFAIIWFGLRGRFDKGPVYNGKHLDEWVELLANYNRQTEVATEAVRGIGTNAYPYLIKWGCHDGAALGYKLPFPLLELLQRHRLIKMADWDRRTKGSLRAFAILAEAGAPPPDLKELEALLHKPGAVRSQYRTVDVLKALGCVGAPSLAQVLTNVSHPARPLVVAHLHIEVSYNITTQFSNCPDIFVLPLISCLSDPRPNVASGAATTLRDLRADPKLIVSGLLSGMANQDPQLAGRCRELLAEIKNRTNATVR